MFNIFTDTKATQSDEAPEEDQENSEDQENLEDQENSHAPKLMECVESQQSIRKKIYETKWFPFRLYNNYLESQYDEILYKAERLYTSPMSIMHHEEYSRSGFYLRLFMVGALVTIFSLKK